MRVGFISTCRVVDAVCWLFFCWCEFASADGASHMTDERPEGCNMSEPPDWVRVRQQVTCRCSLEPAAVVQKLCMQLICGACPLSRQKKSHPVIFARFL